MSLQAITFECEGAELAGVLHLPGSAPRTGVLVVVGGPQYRVGAHRQFVSLARHLAGAGCAVLRFDYRGAGDSDGEAHGFTTLAGDIAAALKAFRAQCPTLERIVLWGLCDGATAAILYARDQPDLAGLILVNPWVRTSSGLARAQVRHYYSRRLLMVDFWRRVLSGDTAFLPAVQAFWGDLRQSFRREAPAADSSPLLAEDDPRLPGTVCAALLARRLPLLVILSGNDLTAREFADRLASREWEAVRALPQLRRVDMEQADHTFSRQDWQQALNQCCADWLRELER